MAAHDKSFYERSLNVSIHKVRKRKNGTFYLPLVRGISEKEEINIVEAYLKLETYGYARNKEGRLVWSEGVIVQPISPPFSIIYRVAGKR
jgi:hypothetical protein